MPHTSRQHVLFDKLFAPLGEGSVLFDEWRIRDITFSVGQVVITVSAPKGNFCYVLIPLTEGQGQHDDLLFVGKYYGLGIRSGDGPEEVRIVLGKLLFTLLSKREHLLTLEERETLFQPLFSSVTRHFSHPFSDGEGVAAFSWKGKRILLSSTRNIYHPQVSSFCPHTLLLEQSMLRFFTEAGAVVDTAHPFADWYSSDFFPSMEGVFGARDWDMSKEEQQSALMEEHYDLILTFGMDRITRKFLATSSLCPVVLLDIHFLDGVRDGGEVLEVQRPFHVYSFFPEFHTILLQAYLTSFAPGQIEMALHYVPFPLEVNYFQRWHPTRGEAYFAGGGHRRDFATVVKVFEGKDHPLTLVGYDPLLREVRQEHTIVHTSGTSPESYIQLMAEAKAVILPLYHETTVTSGLTGLAWALALGKPLIVAKNPTMLPYIQEGVNGFFYEPENLEDLSRVLSCLDNDTLTRLEQGAKRYAEQYMDITPFLTLVGEHIFSSKI